MVSRCVPPPDALCVGIREAAVSAGVALRDTDAEFELELSVDRDDKEGRPLLSLREVCRACFMISSNVVAFCLFFFWLRMQFTYHWQVLNMVIMMIPSMYMEQAR